MKPEEMRQRRLALGINMTQLSRLTGLSYPALRHAENGTWKTHRLTLQHIDRILTKLEKGEKIVLEE